MTHEYSFTAEERGVLGLAAAYGTGLDLSGPRVGRAVKEVARGLVRSGHLSGLLKSLSLTESGRAAVQRLSAPEKTG